MAATGWIALHINKGKTAAQCLADRTNYSENAEKTENGKYISAYECTVETCDGEFPLTRRQYEHITGRHQKIENPSQPHPRTPYPQNLISPPKAPPV